MQKSIALPDVHSGYGFAIGNVAAFDMADPESVVSPGGVGFGQWACCCTAFVTSTTGNVSNICLLQMQTSTVACA